MDTVIGLDLGTSSVKALLLDRQGTVIASKEASYPLASPQPGWAEQEPEDWWQATILVLNQLSEIIKENDLSLLGIGLSGQMNGAVLLDRELNPIRPCIIWADARSVKQCDDIHAKIDIPRLTSITGKLAVTGYTAPKLLWVRDEEPDNYRRVRHLLLPKDYIRYRLTKKLATDSSDASNTLLFDINQSEWSDDILSALGLDASILPPALSSLAVTGNVTREAAVQTGLPEGTPVIAGAGDSSAEAVGSGLIQAGPVLSVIGSAGNISATFQKATIDNLGRIHTGCHVLPSLWIITGVQQAAGLSMRWLLQNLKIYQDEINKHPGSDPYDILNENAAETPPGTEGLIFLPYLTGERTPHLDPFARGVFFGIGIRHNRNHFIRAVLEGVAFAQRDAIELLKKLGVPVKYLISSGGGGRSPLWRQILADVTDLPVMTNGNEQSAAFGAALLAGVGIGMFESIDQACQMLVKLQRSAEPRGEYRQVYDEGYLSFHDLYNQLKPVFAARRGYNV